VVFLSYSQEVFFSPTFSISYPVKSQIKKMVVLQKKPKQNKKKLSGDWLERVIRLNLYFIL